MDNIEPIIEQIKKEECVNFNIMEKYFKGRNFKEIRDYLESHVIDRHITLYLKSAGVIILISNSQKDKVLLQVRSSEKNRLGIFGGGIENDEIPVEAAIRELREELGIEINKKQLKFLGVNEHNLKYENGDKVHYLASLYLLRLNDYPIIKLDNESNGILAISKQNYRDFINKNDENTLQLHKCWEGVIGKILNI